MKNRAFGFGAIFRVVNLRVCIAAAFVSTILAARAQGFSFTTPVGQAGQYGSADGTNTNARFHKPWGLGTDTAGNIYVADNLNHIVRKVSRSGANWVVTTLAGLPGVWGSSDGTNSTARFYYPSGLAVAPSGDVFVADTYNHTIRRLRAYGTNWAVTTVAGVVGIPGAGDGLGTTIHLNYPSGMVSDSAGNLYFTDTDNHSIRWMIPYGEDFIVMTIAGLSGTPGIVDGAGSSARFYYPHGVTVDNGGTVYVADTYNNTIRKVSNATGEWVTTTLAGQPRIANIDDGTNRLARFNYPFGITTDSSGNVYVADTSSDTIRKVMPVGTNWVVSTVSGTALTPGSTDGTAAQFNTPQALVFDAAGNLLVADTDNHTLRLGQSGVNLQAALVGGRLILSWPASTSGYILETRPTLSSGSWITATNAIYTVGSNFIATNNVAAGSGFFRLRKP